MGWQKPISWGGYDTQNGLFYLKNKTNQIVFEDGLDWEKFHAEWEAGVGGWIEKGFELFKAN
jgi:hypothetical protein